MCRCGQPTSSQETREASGSTLASNRLGTMAPAVPTEGRESRLSWAKWCAVTSCPVAVPAVPGSEWIRASVRRGTSWSSWWWARSAMAWAAASVSFASETMVRLVDGPVLGELCRQLTAARLGVGGCAMEPERALQVSARDRIDADGNTDLEHPRPAFAHRTVAPHAHRAKNRVRNRVTGGSPLPTPALISPSDQGKHRHKFAALGRIRTCNLLIHRAYGPFRCVPESPNWPQIS